MLNVSMTLRRFRSSPESSYLILLIAFAAFAGAMTTVEINFSNFLRERFEVGEWFRGFLEFPRESQGFAIAFYIVALGFLTERRLFFFAAMVSAIGAIGLALVPERALEDGISGVIPGLPLILFIMLYSAGQHMGMLIERAIIVEHGDLSSAGTRLGNVGFWKTLAGLVMAGCVFGLKSITKLDYSFFLGLAAALFLFSMLLTALCLNTESDHRLKRRKFVIDRKFGRYYVLSALFGVRKQVFITFAVWVIVVIYDQPVQTIAILWVLTGFTNLFAQPMIGRLIDRFGPRKILTIDALLLCGLCIMYGYGAQLFQPTIGLVVVGLTYILDHILFFVGGARAIYVGKLCSNSEEFATTLSVGLTVDHIFSMTIPFIGGIIWKTAGYEMVFLLAGVIAVATAIVAFGIPAHYSTRAGLSDKIVS